HRARHAVGGAGAEGLVGAEWRTAHPSGGNRDARSRRDGRVAGPLGGSGQVIRRVATGAGLVAMLLTTAVACSGGNGATSGPSGGTGAGTPGVDPSCVIVDMAVSPEKVTLLTDLAETFNASGAKVGDRCAAVRVARKSSGAAATLLEQGWPNPETNGPAPVLWTPAASRWV